MDIRKHFQLASTLMAKNHYEEAREVLEILASNEENSHIMWTLGLVEAQLGNLPKAINYLKKVDKEQFPDVDSIIDELTQKLPKYNTLTREYSYAVSLLNQHKMQDALNILEDIMVWRDRIPLPIHFYYTYLSIMSKINIDLCIAKASELPAFILNTTDIQSIPYLFDDQQQLLLPEPEPVEDIEKYEEMFPPKKPVFGKFKKVILVGIVLVCAYLLFNKYHIQRELVDATENVTTIQEENDSLQEQLEEAQKIQEELQKQIDGTATPAPVEENSTEVEDVQYISTSEAEAEYSTARASYRSGNYEEAIPAYRQAMLGQTEDFYTDDANYYLILSLMEIGQYEEAITECNNFLAKSSTVYKQSIYRNPTSYMMAECYVKLNEKDKAIEVLEDMQDAPEDWAVRSARELLYELQTT